MSTRLCLWRKGWLGGAECGGYHYCCLRSTEGDFSCEITRGERVCKSGCLVASRHHHLLALADNRFRALLHLCKCLREMRAAARRWWNILADGGGDIWGACLGVEREEGCVCDLRFFCFAFPRPLGSGMCRCLRCVGGGLRKHLEVIWGVLEGAGREVWDVLLTF